MVTNKVMFSHSTLFTPHHHCEISGTLETRLFHQVTDIEI